MQIIDTHGNVSVTFSVTRGCTLGRKQVGSAHYHARAILKCITVTKWFIHNYYMTGLLSNKEYTHMCSILSIIYT